MKQNGRFRHESLQDKDSVKALLKAVMNGISAGTLTLSDDDASLVMEPADLLQVKINAAVDEERNKIDIRITWQGAKSPLAKKSLKIK